MWSEIDRKCEEIVIQALDLLAENFLPIITDYTVILTFLVGWGLISLFQSLSLYYLTGYIDNRHIRLRIFPLLYIVGPLLSIYAIAYSFEASSKIALGVLIPIFWKIITYRLPEDLRKRLDPQTSEDLLNSHRDSS